MVHIGSFPTNIDTKVIAPYIKKIFSKSKATHSLRYDSLTDQIKLKTDKSKLGVLYIEAPFILLPHFDVLKLIETGKCCSYCGEVLKLYDVGKMKDDGNKASREKRTTADKHERFINGLDCSDCEGRWCDNQCKLLDFKHNFLHHRPMNKTTSHPFLDINGDDKDTFFFDNWKKIESLIIKENNDWLYNTIMCILHLYHDPSLEATFSALPCWDAKSSDEMKRFMTTKGLESEISIEEIHSMLLACFKNLDLPLEKFLKYVSVYYLNNYHGSIYLIFSCLTKSASMEPNVKVEPFDGGLKHDFEEFVFKKTEDNNVCLFKTHHTDGTTLKPIYTNRTSGVVEKQLIQLVCSKMITTNDALVLTDQDYSNPLEPEDDEIAFISDEHDEADVPRLIVPVPPPSGDQNIVLKTPNPKLRKASFTSSGNSFGEGIIKFNRDQIREMLENMSNNFIDEESGDDADEAVMDDHSSSTGSVTDAEQKIVNAIKNLQINPSHNQRRKSVKFEDTVITI